MEALNKNILLAGEVIAERWKVVEKIGEGTFSQIYLAFSLHDNKRVAVKVEAPSALKPVLEWEASILKSLQDCDHVCRYYYHGKHVDSTVLVMELLGESMSMLRVAPDAIHGVPLARCVSVGLEMLDCIEAFHRHGFVHRDIKASNFAMSESSNPAKRKYFIIDFGLSRQHVGDDQRVIPARAMAEFRGTSMYASLSSHRRQELGPKDDLWSWFYLVMDFLRGELPWATDAQRKHRETVLTLKEYYTEKCPSLLVEGLVGATHLVAIMKYLQSLAYSDAPDYDLLRRKLKRVETGSKEEDAMELWVAIESPRERALQWAMRAKDALAKHAATVILETLLAVAKRFGTFFGVADLSVHERLDVQRAVFEIERKLDATATHALAPPPIQSFVKRRQSEQKGRSDALRRRRERDFQIRQVLELKARRGSQLSGATLGTQSAGSPVSGVSDANGTPRHSQDMARVVKSDDSAMDMSDGDETATPPPPSQVKTLAPVDSAARQPSTLSGPPLPPPPPPMPQAQRWHLPAVRSTSTTYSSSPRPPLPLQPGAPNGGGSVYGNQPPLPPGPMYPPLPTGAAFTPPLPPPLPPGYVASPSGKERRSPEPETRNSDRSSSHHRREREPSHRERSRRSRRSHSREHRRSRHRSVSSSRSRSRSFSRSRSRSSSRGRSHSPAHSSSRSRRRHRSQSSSPSRSPRRRGSRSHSSRSHSSRSSERHHYHHHHHHYYIKAGGESRRSRERSSLPADDHRSRRESTRWQPK